MTTYELLVLNVIIAFWEGVKSIVLYLNVIDNWFILFLLTLCKASVPAAP